MGERLKRAWRIVGTGLGWLWFGACGLAITLGLPLLRRLPSRAPELRAQRLNHRIYRSWERFIVRLGVIDVHWSGLERIADTPPRIYVANHPTLIDAPLILARMRQGDLVVAREQARHWALRGAVAAAGYVSNAAGPGVVDACVARLRAGHSLVLFPEGTRSPPGALGPFQRGAAHIALRSGCELVPIVVRVEPPMLRKGQKWYDVPSRTGHFSFRVLDPIAPKQFSDDARSQGQNARSLTHELRRVLGEGLFGADEGGSRGGSLGQPVEEPVGEWNGLSE